MKNVEQELQNKLVCTYLKNVGEYNECYRAFEDSEIIAAYEAAIEALEKQIRMKPVFKISKWVSCNNCPRCGSPILPENVGVANYCDDCGQALDWSKMEDGEPRYDD